MLIVINIEKTFVRRFAIGCALTLAIVVLFVPSITRAVSERESSSAQIGVPHVFVNGGIADANEVNANFNVLVSELNSHAQRIDDIGDGVLSEAQLGQVVEFIVANRPDLLRGLRGERGMQGIRGLPGEPGIAGSDGPPGECDPGECGPTPAQVQVLDQMTLVNLPDGQGGLARTVRFTGVNVQIVNGRGETITTNSLGNLIVGYQEPRIGGDPSIRTGSHNIIVGLENNYSSFGGLVVGADNEISGRLACVSGGLGNAATGDFSSVSGGTGNVASGASSSVSGGIQNEARANRSTVSGGFDNRANSAAIDATVSGGCSVRTATPCAHVP